MDSRVLATSSESRLSTSLGDLLDTFIRLIIKMVAVRMMIAMVRFLNYEGKTWLSGGCPP